MDVPISPRDQKHNQSHNLTEGPELSSVGIAYVVFVIVYTVSLIYGLIHLWHNRMRTAVRIRNFWINTAAILSIHVYLAALFIVYPLNDSFKCGTEFWYMNTVFPLGIALFQASNVRLMAYAKAQQGMIRLKCYGDEKQPFGLSVASFRLWFLSIDFVRKTYVCIGFGLIVQLIATLILFLGSRRFSPHIGFFGRSVDPATCRTGFEWIPSVVWQCLWAWIFGPAVLFTTRNIRDTHYWGLQTRLAIFAGMPGTPLWLIFLYVKSPALARVNAWWPPAMWFAPGLIVMQVTSIIFPALDIYHENHRRSQSLAPSSVSSVSTTGSTDGDPSRKSKELANSYQAFEYHIRHCILPLLEFSVHRDFTSENLLFLRDVRNFKTKWRRIVILAPTRGRPLNVADEIEMFEDAARIFFELVKTTTAPIPINIESKIYYELAQKFKNVKYEPPIHAVHKTRSTKRSGSIVRMRSLSGKINKDNFRKAVAPWESPSLHGKSLVVPANALFEPLHTNASHSSESETALIEIGLDSRNDNYVLEPKVFTGKKTNDIVTTPTAHVTFTTQPLVQAPAAKANIAPIHALSLDPGGIPTTNSHVPMSFDMHVFDKAEQSIKYLVYTNTWKSYIKGLSKDVLSRLSVHALEGQFVPRRGGQGGMSRMTDVELYDLDLELQEKMRMHHGVLDPTVGPVPIADVDSRCAACRRKIERRLGELASDDHGISAVNASNGGYERGMGALDGADEQDCGYELGCNDKHAGLKSDGYGGEEFLK